MNSEVNSSTVFDWEEGGEERREPGDCISILPLASLLRDWLGQWRRDG